MKLEKAINGCTGSFIALDGTRYYVGNIFDTPRGHDGIIHPVVADFGGCRIFGRFGKADGSEYKRFSKRRLVQRTGGQ